MLPSTLSINPLVNVQVNLSPNAAQIQNISTLLILGTSNIIDIAERYRSYGSISAVAADFGTTAEEYLAAVLWFEQLPQPTQLLIGRWAKTAAAAVLKGGTLSSTQQLIATWNAITAGSAFFNIDGVPLSLTGLNFASQTNLNGVASTIQAALIAKATAFGLASAASITAVWNSVFSRFEVQSGTTGVTSTMQFAALSAASGFFNFASNPAANDTIALNGTTWTFVSALTTGNQILLGGTLAATLVNALSTLLASTDTNTALFNYSVNGNYLYVSSKLAGTAGNAYTIVKTSTAITVSAATLLNGVATGDVSAMLAMQSTSSGAYVAQGIAAETALAAATLFDNNYGQTWYGMQIPSASDSDHQAVASFIEGTTSKHTYWISTIEAGALSSVSTTDIAAIMSKMTLNRTMLQWSSSNQYAAASLAAKALSVNYQASNTVIDLMYKQEPGITAESVNASQATTLNSKNANVFIAYNNNTAIIQYGNNVNGVPIDIITGTDWLALDIQTALYNALYLSQTKIPQTDAGNHTLLTIIESRLSQAVQNGLLAPGEWDVGGFGTLNQGDYLPKGFYVYAPPITSQSQADRSARKSVPFQIAAKLAGAIRTISVIINVNR
ncbi:MAG: DUF3383 family protein [Nitrososphaerota archaeon]|nr:DUF3383 family protein [Nitrososphaerota archaeon]